jgi:prepilin-type N-terminal cleavage/methylation domain-containing protein
MFISKKQKVYPMKRMQFNRAFTLIELLVVIAIVGILSGFIFVSMNSAITSAKDAKRKADMSSIEKALMTYGAQHGSYPIEATECDINSNCNTLAAALVPAYLGVLPSDPITGVYCTINTYQPQVRILRSRESCLPDNGCMTVLPALGSPVILTGNTKKQLPFLTIQAVPQSRVNTPSS